MRAWPARGDGVRVGSRPVVFEFRTGDDHSHQAVAGVRLVTGIQAGCGIDRVHQVVAQRHAELIVSDLSSDIAGRALRIVQNDREPSQTLIFFHGIDIAVRWIVVFEHENAELQRPESGSAPPAR